MSTMRRLFILIPTITFATCVSRGARHDLMGRWRRDMGLLRYDTSRSLPRLGSRRIMQIARRRMHRRAINRIVECLGMHERLNRRDRADGLLRMGLYWLRSSLRRRLELTCNLVIAHSLPGIVDRGLRLVLSLSLWWG